MPPKLSSLQLRKRKSERDYEFEKSKRSTKQFVIYKNDESIDPQVIGMNSTLHSTPDAISQESGNSDSLVAEQHSDTSSKVDSTPDQDSALQSTAANTNSVYSNSNRDIYVDLSDPAFWPKDSSRNLTDHLILHGTKEAQILRYSRDKDNRHFSDVHYF